MPIIWTMPDSSVRVMQLSTKFLEANRLDGETTAQAVARLAVGEQAKNPEMAGAAATLVTTANMTTDRTKRHKWRLSGTRCVVDDTVPDLPHRRQSLLDQINAAVTLDQVKQSLVDWVRMRG